MRLWARTQIRNVSVIIKRFFRAWLNCARSKHFIEQSASCVHNPRGELGGAKLDTLTRIRAFIDVVEAEGFSAAARKTGRSKALLSK
ncbi:MAG: helix-turn-helix domain-containing protein, partial [Allorhizobium sp.]